MKARCNIVYQHLMGIILLIGYLRTCYCCGLGPVVLQPRYCVALMQSRVIQSPVGSSHPCHTVLRCNALINSRDCAHPWLWRSLILRPPLVVAFSVVNYPPPPSRLFPIVFSTLGNAFGFSPYSHVCHDPRWYEDDKSSSAFICWLVG